MDARIKLLLLLAFLVSVALLKNASVPQLSVCFLYLLAVLCAGRLPLLRILRISLVVIPFVGLFSLMIYFAGDLHRAEVILLKSYLSALAVMTCIASTSLPQLTKAARSLHFPSFFIEVTQLIYRYVFVLTGEIQVMRTAFLARCGHAGWEAFQSAAGMVAVLFARAFEKATAVQNAMLSRGFSGTLPDSPNRRLRSGDLGLLSVGLLMVIAVHFL